MDATNCFMDFYFTRDGAEPKWSAEPQLKMASASASAAASPAAAAADNTLWYGEYEGIFIAGSPTGTMADTYSGEKDPIYGTLSNDGSDYLELYFDKTHDGCEYVFNQCLCLGVPQMLITDGTWRSSWNANAAVRLGIGVTLDADLVTMAALYEGYRRLLSDDGYRARCDLIARQACALGDLSEFMKWPRLRTASASCASSSAASS